MSCMDQAQHITLYLVMDDVDIEILEINFCIRISGDKEKLIKLKFLLMDKVFTSLKKKIAWKMVKIKSHVYHYNHITNQLTSTTA